MGNGTDDPGTVPRGTSAGERLQDSKEGTDDWEIECSDDESYNPTGQPGHVWEPRPEDIRDLYERLARGEELSLEWICPGRRSPSPEKGEDETMDVKEEPEEKKAEEKNIPSGFDFDEEMDAPGMKPGFTPRRTPGSGATPRSQKKRVATMDKIMNDIQRHKKIEAAERRSTPGRRLPLTPSGAHRKLGPGGQRRLLGGGPRATPPGGDVMGFTAEGKNRKKAAAAGLMTSGPFGPPGPGPQTDPGQAKTAPQPGSLAAVGGASGAGGSSGEMAQPIEAPPPPPPAATTATPALSTIGGVAEARVAEAALTGAMGQLSCKVSDSVNQEANRRLEPPVSQPPAPPPPPPPPAPPVHITAPHALPASSTLTATPTATLPPVATTLPTPPPAPPVRPPPRPSMTSATSASTSIPPSLALHPRASAPPPPPPPPPPSVPPPPPPSQPPPPPPRPAPPVAPTTTSATTAVAPANSAAAPSGSPEVQKPLVEGVGGEGGDAVGKTGLGPPLVPPPPPDNPGQQQAADTMMDT